MGNGWIRDLRYALRQLLRHRLHSATAILTLALGIGGTVALSSVVYGLLLRPLPYAQSEQIAVFWGEYDWMQSEFEFSQARVPSMSALAAFSNWTVSLRDQGAAQMVHVVDGSAELFNVLGRQPLLGRGFEPADQKPGAEPTVVLSHTLWRDRFAADPGVIGRQINLDGKATTVIGVAAPDFFFPNPDISAWRALTIDPADPDYRGNGYLTLIGRWRDGVSSTLAQQEILALGQALGQEYRYPEAWDKSRDAHVAGIREHLFGDVRPAVLLLLGAAGLLLLMACSNVSALVVVRVMERRSELALRGALGARPGRLALQITIETLVLSTIAALLAVAVAAAGFDLLVNRLPLGDGFASTIEMNWAGLAVAGVLALLCGVVTGLIPSSALLRGRINNDLGNQRSAAGASGRASSHNLLIGAQVLFAVVLTVSSAMLIRTVDALQEINLGIRAHGVVSLDLVSNPNEMSGSEREQFYAEALRQAQALPGIESAGLTNRLPLRDGGWQGGVKVPSRPDLSGGNQPNVVFRSATPDFFEAMGVRLLQGRSIEIGDSADSELVTLVSESFANAMWPGESALGKQVVSSFEDGPRAFTIVGVLAEMRLFDLTNENPFVMYIPHAQRVGPGTSQVLVLRTDMAPGSIEESLTQMVRGLDSRVAVDSVTTIAQVVEGSMVQPLQLRFYLTLLAALSLLLGAIGVFGVVNHSVTRRRPEYAVRLALGATSKSLLTQVLQGAAKPIILGAAAGLMGVVLIAQWLTSFLYGMEPTDPISMALGVGALLLIALAAAMLPALRATRISPAATLRDG